MTSRDLPSPLVYGVVLGVGERGAPTPRLSFLSQESARVINLPGAADDELFRGGVPQPADWIRAWQACRCPVSYRAAHAQGVTENFIHGVRRRRDIDRRAFAAMVAVMALASRKRILDQLVRAYAITVLLDDRGPFRLLRFKCNAPRSTTAEDVSASATGCLGVLRRGGVSKSRRLEHLDDDYSQAMAESVRRVFRRYAVNDDGGVDDTLLKSIFLKVRIGLADGAASVQKCLKILATSDMPNMRLVLRDLAHMVRNSTRDPLLAESTFAEWWDDIFGNKHALVPDMRNSDEWREKLLICQRAVLEQCGAQGGGVSVVSRVMSFAKQRFDSCATPQRQFCCMLAAIAMVLAYQASDARNSCATRERSARRLRQMPRHVLTAGLAATYSEECIRFVRVFDVDDHDPARTVREKNDFARRMTTLFLDGHVFVDPQHPSAAIVGPNVDDGVSESRGLTCLSMIWQQAKDTPTIYYGAGHAVHLYHKPSKEDRQKIAHSVHAVVDTMLERLDAELSPETLEALYDIFDVPSWHRALSSAQTGDESLLSRLRRRARKYADEWRVGDARVGASQLESAACVLLQAEKERIIGGQALDNRILWSRVLEDDFAQHHTTSGRYKVLPNMIRIYTATLDTTGPLERGLGKLTEILQAHSGPMDEDGEHASQLAEIVLNGPRSVEELATRSDESWSPGVSESLLNVESVLLPTDLSRDLARTWVSLHGRRFRCYKASTKPRGIGAIAKKTGTMAALARKTAAGSRTLLAAAPRAPAAENHRTVLGVPRSQFVRRRGAHNPAASAPKLVKYQKFTQTKKQRKRVLEAARCRTRGSEVNPYSVPLLNPHKRMRLGTGLPAAASSSGVSASSSAGTVLNMTGAPLPALGADAARYDIQTADSDSSLIAATLKAGMIVWQHSWLLDRSVPDCEFLKSAFLVVAAGKSVLGLGHWRGRRPHQSTALVSYAAAVEVVPAILILQEPRVSKHRGLCQVIQRCAKLPRSKWQVRTSAPTTPAGQVFKLATVHDTRSFLQSARRLRRGGAAGGYFPPTRR